MVNWYYVQGSERMGPVGVEALRELFSKGDLNLESYVWRKGFQNWERLKDVNELDFSGSSSSTKVAVVEEVVQESSPEMNFNFDWKKVKEEDELFFLQTGHDRKTELDSKYFGPYSITELREALDEKRINHKTLLFAAGMPGWVEVGETPLNPVNVNLNIKAIKGDAPLFMLMKHDPLPLVALVNHAGTKECTLLGAGHFEEGEALCSMYVGANLKAKNIKLNIEKYNPKLQKIVCKIVEMNDNAKKLMQNYAD
jgi:hypothetical protein